MYDNSQKRHSVLVSSKPAFFILYVFLQFCTKTKYWLENIIFVVSELEISYHISHRLKNIRKRSITYFVGIKFCATHYGSQYL